MKHLKPYHNPPLAPLGELFHQQIVAGPKWKCNRCSRTFLSQTALQIHGNICYRRRQASPKDDLVGRLPKFIANGIAAQRAINDVCARKHGGNPESQEAFASIRDRLSQRQSVVLKYLRELGDYGATVDQIARNFDTNPNNISGRVTELKIKGLVEKRGRRRTRSGCMASVIVAK